MTTIQDGVFRLLYVSDLAAHTGSMLSTVLEDILVASARNNLRDGLTGFLLCDGARFVQMLEGDQAAVEACFAAILSDNRHHHVSVRLKGPIAERDYPRWSMCALTLSPQEDAWLNAEHFEFDLRRAAPGALAQHLLGIAQRHADELDALHARLLESGRR